MNNAALHGKRILILEDDYYLASDEKSLVERAGGSVVGPLGRSCTVQEIAAAGKLNGAIVDINLGNGPNFALSRELASRGVPFVFVTGYDATAIPADLSHVPRIEKPVMERKLISVLAQVTK